MKNLDPKIAVPLSIVVILVALFAIARMAGIGNKMPSTDIKDIKLPSVPTTPAS